MWGFQGIALLTSKRGCENIDMDEETLNFFTWQIERGQAERVKAALKKADSGHLVEHSRLKAMATEWCKIDQNLVKKSLSKKKPAEGWLK